MSDLTSEESDCYWSESLMIYLCSIAAQMKSDEVYLCSDTAQI